jgi:hypothetical protein
MGGWWRPAASSGGRRTTARSRGRCEAEERVRGGWAASSRPYRAPAVDGGDAAALGRRIEGGGDGAHGWRHCGGPRWLGFGKWGQGGVATYL